MKYTPAQLISRYEALRTSRRTVESVWNEITRLVFPYKGDMFRDYPDEQSVDWRDNRDTFDSTAIFAANTLAASIHGSLTSPTIRWFELRFREDDVNEIPGAKEWLEDTAEKIYQALQDSNFNLEANEMYQDLVGYGTSILVEEDRSDVAQSDEWMGVDFQCIPIRECFFEANARGQVALFYRRHDWTAVQICSKFREEDVPDKIKKQAQSAESMGSNHEVVFCVYPLEFNTEDMDQPDTTKPISPERRPFQWAYVLKSDKTTLASGGYYEMPAFVPRWRKMSGSQWGYSPAMVALPDIKTLNAITEQGLVAGEKAIDPPIFVPERDIFSDLDFTAGAVNVVRSTEGIVPFTSTSDYQQEVSREERLQMSIRQPFHADDLMLKESPAMTATEVQARMELMQRLLGPTLGRLQSDFLDPLIERTFKILWRAGQLNEMPEGVNTSEMDISYLGPMSRAQSADKVASIDRWVMSQVQLAEINPEVLDNIDFDMAARESAKLLGTPAKVVRDKDEVDQLREARAEQQKKQQQMDTMQQGSEVVKNVGGAEGMQQMQQMQGGEQPPAAIQ